MIIRLPSKLGTFSGFPNSSRSAAKRASRSSPCSLKTMEDIGLDFVSFLEEFLRVLELEVVIVVIGLRSETNLLHLLLLLVGLCLFLLFLLRVEEFLVVNDSADRRIRSSRDLDQIEVEVIGYFHSLLKRVDTLLYIIANKAHLCDPANLIVNTMRVFFNNSTATRSGRNSCYSFSR